MAGVLNNTCRQYNLKSINTNSAVTVRIPPGFSIVDSKIWSEFVSKNAYVAKLKKNGFIDFGSRVDDMELEKDNAIKAQVKLVPLPKNQ